MTTKKLVLMPPFAPGKASARGGDREKDAGIPPDLMAFNEAEVHA